MGCSSCGSRAAAAGVYPRVVSLPDGTRREVSSASDERAQIAAAQRRMRDAAKSAAADRGYSVTRR